MSPYDLPAVLYCDCEVLLRRVFQAELGYRFRVFLCSSAQEALDVLEKRGDDIGVVVSELHMPFMNGAELLERVRTLAPHARRMAVTGCAPVRTVEDALNRGQVMRYFVKPWERAEMLAAIDEALKLVHEEKKRQEVASQMRQAERLATLRQVTADIADELQAPVSYLSLNVASLRRDLEQVIEYVNKHLAEDPDQDVSATLKDLPSLIADLEMGTDHLRAVVNGLKAQWGMQDGGKP